MHLPVNAALNGHRASSFGLILLIVAGAFVCASLLSSTGSRAATAANEVPRAPEASSRPDQRNKLAGAFGKLPLSFAANLGQADSRARFIARGPGYNLFLTSDEAVLALRSETLGATEGDAAGEDEGSSRAGGAVVRMKLIGANRKAKIEGLDELPGKLNYMLGNDAQKWRTNIPTYSQVKYGDAYPGIDVLYHGNQQQLEYDFLIAPGASPRRIKMAFPGARKISVDAHGDLVLRTAAGDVRQHKPIAYQEFNGERREVAVSYKLKGNQVTFSTGAYDRRRQLIIDPVLVYSTFFGGNGGEVGLGIAIDVQANTYLTGQTSSTNFPTSGAFQGTLGGGDVDAFVVKLNPSGTAVVYATYLGGDSEDIGNAIAVDAQGSAYVVGQTFSITFPTTAGAIQDSRDGSYDAFVTKLSPSGSFLAYSTYLGGGNPESGYGVAVDAGGRAYVVGTTESTGFRTVPFSSPRNGNPAYKSTDGAGNWSAASTGLDESIVNSLAVAPSDSNIIYAGTADGVFKSVDAGAHWNLTAPAQPAVADSFIYAVAVDPTNPAIVYAGSAVGLFKSTNGGATYTEQFHDGGQALFPRSLAIDPNTPTTVYAGMVLGTLYKTIDGGTNWIQMRAGLPSTRVFKVVIDPTNAQTVYAATNSGMYKTTNGAAIWGSITSGIPFGQIISLAIDPIHPDTLYCGTTGHRLYKTTNGGATWSLSNNGLSNSTVDALAVDPVTPTTIYAAMSLAGICKSTDAGANWVPANTSLANLALNEIVIDRNNPATLYVGTTMGADVFAVRFNASGSALEYLTNFGGTENDEAHGVAVEADSSAYITGHTESQNFPVLNAFQAENGGGIGDAFVTKLNPSGSGFVHSTYLGGSEYDSASAIAVRAGSAYITGQTRSNNFPVVNSLKAPPANFDNDAFVTKFSPAGTALDFSTCLGGGAFDHGFGLALDGSGNVYVTGLTNSVDFPIVAAPQPSRGGNSDAFVTKLNAAGSAIVYSTYLGGSDEDQGNGIAVDALGNSYTVGTTFSNNFPTTPGVFQSTLKGTDAFVTKIGVDSDLSITKKESHDPVMVGNPLTYTLTVTNAGPSTTTAVTVTDALPAGLTFSSATPTQGSCSFSAPTVTCNLGTLSAATVATITLAVVPNTPGTITNTATVTGSESDSNSANNSASETTEASASPSINGEVTSGGSGVSGVLMTLSGSQSATTQTDSNGFYQFAEVPAGGNFTVTPSKANLSFDPQARTFNPLNSDQTADFVASTCTFSILPTSQSFSAGGGSGSINVTTLQGCPWTAVSAADWITITSGASGVGSGTVNFNVSVANATRSGHITVAGLNFPVYQEFDSCGTPSFSGAIYDLPSGPTLVRSADLNGDGSLDLALVTGALSGGGLQASVLLNDGSGAFTQSSFETQLGNHQGIVVTDFNGDSRPDIAMTSHHLSSVRIFFNNGNGGFGQSKVDIPFTSQGQTLTRELFTSDLNGDAMADLLVQTPEADRVQVLLGNGTGGFTQIAPVDLGVLAATAVVDVNDDHIPDLVLGGNTVAGSLGVMLGNGSGGFGTVMISTGNDLTSHPNAGDMDGDGKIDLVVSGGTINGFSVTPALVVMAGDGAGHFTKKGSFGTSIADLAVADFNNDGKLDVAVTKGVNEVTVVPGDGVGGFASPFPVTIGNNSGGGQGIVATDLSGDSRPDLGVALYLGGATILRNNCAGAPSISGRITDSRTNRGLEGVGITLGPLQVIITKTDAGGNYFIGPLTAGGNYDVVPTKENFKFNPAHIVFNNLTGSQTANFIATPTVVQFTQIHYLVEESAASVQVNVSRSGDLSGTTTVNYTTVNGTASDRSDFTAAVGTLHFSPGEALKSFNVLLTDDALVEGFESLRLVLSNPSGALLATPLIDGLSSDVLMEIHDNDSSGNPNPIGDSQFFVRQHYHDFLNREPDADGLQFWVNQIESCGADAACREVKRINVSAAFFLSIEFQETGYLAYRMYNAAYGETTSPNVAGTVPSVRLQDFLPDTQRIGQEVQVGIGDWQQQLEDNKTAYALDFVQRQRFLTAFPLTMTAAEFVDRLDQNTNGVLSADEQSQLLALLAATPADAARRASVVKKVAEDSDLRQRELNRAFVLMQYYGYLRRNPDDPPDTDFRGWKFWLDKLNEFNGNFIDAEMVKSFLVAGEYRQRFGTP